MKNHTCDHCTDTGSKTLGNYQLIQQLVNRFEDPIMSSLLKEFLADYKSAHKRACHAEKHLELVKILCSLEFTKQ